MIKIFEVLTKAGIMTAAGNPAGALKEAAGLIPFLKLKTKIDEIGYEFIIEALKLTTAEILKENEGLLSIELTKKPFLDKDNQYVQLLNKVSAFAFEYEPFTRKLLDSPTDAVIFQKYKIQLTEWLALILKEPNEANKKASAKTIASRLNDYFIFHLHEVWVENVDKYQVLLKQFNSPFDEALRRNLERKAYNAYLRSLQI